LDLPLGTIAQVLQSTLRSKTFDIEQLDTMRGRKSA
jgi:hypothetical protein